MTDSPVSSTIAGQSGGLGDRRNTGGGENKSEDVGKSSASEDPSKTAQSDGGEGDEIDNGIDEKFIVIDEDADSASDAEAENGLDESSILEDETETTEIATDCLEKSTKPEEDKANSIQESENEVLDQISNSNYSSNQKVSDSSSKVTESTAAVIEGVAHELEPTLKEDSGGNKKCSDSTQDDLERRTDAVIEGEPKPTLKEDIDENKTCSDSTQDDVEMRTDAVIEDTAQKNECEPTPTPEKNDSENKTCSDSTQDDVEMRTDAVIEDTAQKIECEPKPTPEKDDSENKTCSDSTHDDDVEMNELEPHTEQQDCPVKIVNDDSIPVTVVTSSEDAGTNSEIVSVQQTSRKRTFSDTAGDEVAAASKLMKVEGEEENGKKPVNTEKEMITAEDKNPSEVIPVEDSPQKNKIESEKPDEDRAKSSNKPSPAAAAPKVFPKNIVWVSNITKHVKAAEISTLFSKYGRVIGAKILSDKCSNFFAVIRMDSNENAERCIRNLHKIKVQGRTINVTSSMPAMSNNQKSKDQDSTNKERDSASKRDRDSSSKRERDSSSKKSDETKTRDAKSESNGESSKSSREDKNKRDSKSKSDDHESCKEKLDDAKRRLGTAIRDNRSLKEKLKVLSSTQEKLSNAKLNAMTFEKKYLDLAIKHKEFIKEYKARREEVDQLKNERADLLKKSMELENERAVFEKAKMKLEKDLMAFEEEKSGQQLKMADINRNFELNCINLEKDFERLQKEREVIEKGRMSVEQHSLVLQRGFEHLKAERHRLQLIGDALEVERINVKDYHNRVTEILEMCEKTLMTGSSDNSKQDESKTLLNRISTLLAKGHLNSPDLTLPAMSLTESLLPRDQSIETIQPLGNVFPEDDTYKSNSYTSENVILISTEETLPEDQEGVKSDMSFSMSEEEDSGAISPWRNVDREENRSNTPPLTLQGKPVIVGKMKRSNVKSRLGGKTNERTLAEKASYVRSKLLSSRLKEEHDEISKLRQTYKKLQEENVELMSAKERTRTPPPRFGPRDLRFDLKKSKEYVPNRGHQRKKF